MINAKTPLLERTHIVTVDIRAVIKKASQKAFVSDLPTHIFKLVGWTSKEELLIASIIAIIMNMIFVASLVFIDYSAILAILGIKLKISDNNNISIKVAIVIVKLIFDFINAMGAAYSEIQKEDQERTLAQQERELAQQRHQEIMIALSQQAGVITTDDMKSMVRDFKQSLFEEHKATIINQISNVVVDHTSKLDVMERYDIEKYVSEQELKQCRLSDA